MSVIISEELQEKLEIVGRKTWWPVATLADVLGKPKSYVYRRLGKEDFLKPKFLS